MSTNSFDQSRSASSSCSTKRLGLKGRWCQSRALTASCQSSAAALHPTAGSAHRIVFIGNAMLFCLRRLCFSVFSDERVVLDPQQPLRPPRLHAIGIWSRRGILSASSRPQVLTVGIVVSCNASLFHESSRCCAVAGQHLNRLQQHRAEALQRFAQSSLRLVRWPPNCF